MAIGLILALVLSLSGLQANAGWWQKWQQKQSSRRLKRQMKAAARTQNWGLFRRKARQYLRSRGLGEPEIIGQLAPLDAALYGDKSATPESLQEFAGKF